MTASVKTPLKVIVQNTQMEKPTIKTPIAKRKISREDEIGACWGKQPLSGGEEYMTGNVTIGGIKTAIVMFRNGFKDSESKPDWRIYRRQELQGGQVSAVSQSESSEQDPGMLS